MNVSSLARRRDELTPWILPIRVWTTLFAVFVSAVLLAGCTPSAYESAESRATAGVGIQLERVIERTSEFFHTSTSSADLASDSMQDIFLSIAPDAVPDVLISEGGLRAPALYAVALADGGATLSIFVQSKASDSRGLEVANVSRWGCAELTGTFGDPQVSLTDVPCPEWVVEPPGGFRDEREVSLSDAAERDQIDVNVTP